MSSRDIVSSTQAETVYQKTYHTMFHAATDAIEKLQDAAVILYNAQQDCEQIFITAAEPSLEIYRESAE